jgi:hypothetical protein
MFVVMRLASRWLGPLAAAGLVFLVGVSGARAASNGDAASSGGDAAGTKKKTTRKPTGKKGAPKSKGSSPEAKTAHARPGHLARQKAIDGSPDAINENVKLTPFPSHPEAAKKALAQNRRDELDDAEKAARSGDQADRWQTVLFHLRNLDARADPEGCFWRVVAYYRLGQMERARTLRQSCELNGKDAALIDAEDAQAARLQPLTALADKEPPAPVANPAPYVGAGPTRLER